LAATVIDAVVVTHNSKLDLPGLVQNAELRKAFARLVVVDSASTDSTVAIAQRGGLEVFARQINHGFGAAANEGVRHTSAPFVCILNADIRFTTSDVATRLAAQFADEAVGVVAPTLVLPDGREQDSARQVPLPTDLMIRRLRHANLGALTAAAPGPVPWVAGAFLLIRRKAFTAVNGFDERFHLYFEDVDLCVRLRNSGWQVIFDPSVRVSHHHRAASRGSLIRRSTRQHVLSALRFYSYYPRHLVARNPSMNRGVRS
jgi:N-acetylglucosaminyl-diphospho-decaprenol L-rhamnosyltransferase